MFDCTFCVMKMFECCFVLPGCNSGIFLALEYCYKWFRLYSHQQYNTNSKRSKKNVLQYLWLSICCPKDMLHQKQERVKKESEEETLEQSPQEAPCTAIPKSRLCYPSVQEYANRNWKGNCNQRQRKTKFNSISELSAMQGYI